VERLKRADAAATDPDLACRLLVLAGMSACPTPPLARSRSSFTLKRAVPVWVIPKARPRSCYRQALLIGAAALGQTPCWTTGRAQLLAVLLSPGLRLTSVVRQLARIWLKGLGDELRCEASEDGLLIQLKCASRTNSPALLPLPADDGAQPWLANDHE